MMKTKLTVAASAVALLAICGSAQAGHHEEGLKAVADIKGCTNPDISGTATIVEQVRTLRRCRRSSRPGPLRPVQARQRH